MRSAHHWLKDQIIKVEEVEGHCRTNIELDGVWRWRFSIPTAAAGVGFAGLDALCGFKGAVFTAGMTS